MDEVCRDYGRPMARLEACGLKVDEKGDGCTALLGGGVETRVDRAAESTVSTSISSSMC
jgi:hypothetical protein